MDRGFAPAPAEPAALCAENIDRLRQVIGRIPVVKRPPILLVRNIGAHDEATLGHRVFLFDPHARHVVAGYGFQYRIVKENLASDRQY